MKTRDSTWTTGDSGGLLELPTAAPEYLDYRLWHRYTYLEYPSATRVGRCSPRWSDHPYGRTRRRQHATWTTTAYRANRIFKKAQTRPLKKKNSSWTTSSNQAAGADDSLRAGQPGTITHKNRHHATWTPTPHMGNTILARTVVLHEIHPVR